MSKNDLPPGLRPFKVIPIAQWSASKHETFSKCKLRAQLQYGQKIPEPPRPLPPGKTEHANDRGTRIHTEAELYVQGKGPFTDSLAKFRPEFESLKSLYSEGRVSLEGEWACDRNWNPVAWNGEWIVADSSETARSIAFEVARHTTYGIGDEDRPDPKTIGEAKKALKLPPRGRNGDVILLKKTYYVWVPAWLRLKLDAIVFLSEFEAVVIDYKSGKRFGNEMKHAEQTQLYQLVSLLRYPKLEIVHTELWYLDVDEIAHSMFTRRQGMRFLASFTSKGRAITECTEFPPNAHAFNCQKNYCPYGPWEGGTGHCLVGIPR